jgi:polyhydroxybutyrate depolymerase
MATAVPPPGPRFQVDPVTKIVESSTSSMDRVQFIHLSVIVLAACGGSPAGGPDAADDVAGGDAPICGIRTGMRGKTQRMVKAAGLDRTYIVYLPPDADPAKPLPLVFVHHGYTMSGEIMFDITGYPALADAEGIALAFPDGQGGPNSFSAPWNVGTDLCPAAGGGAPPQASGDDFAMLDAIEADIALDQCIDTEHVFVTGFSMGGYFSHHTGCMRDDIRAVAPHSGGTHAFDSCTTQHKPVIIFHGMSDGIVPNSCDDPTVTSQPGVTPSATAWAQKNGCGSTRTLVDVDGGSCAYYDNCPDDGQVAICTFSGMGHCWAGGKQSVFGCASYASATALEWQFFKTHAW